VNSRLVEDGCDRWYTQAIEASSISRLGMPAYRLTMPICVSIGTQGACESRIQSVGFVLLVLVLDCASGLLSLL
jgi:hypothetical protein